MGRREVLLTRDPVLFLMIEERFGFYVASALLRALTGRRTAGLLLRPGPALAGTTLRAWVKRTVLKLLKWLPQVQTVTILPFALEPGFAAIADDWIHDFQLWDMAGADRDRLEAIRAGAPGAPADAVALVTEARRRAAGRTVLSAIGTQSRSKGFTLLAEAMAAGDIDDWSVLAAGRVPEDQRAACERFRTAGGWALDRMVSDDEILAAYAVADAVWCLYDPSYDQASGILGRAVQFGVPAVVREGSLSHRFCSLEDIPHVTARGEGDVAAALAALPPVDPLAGRQLSERLRTENITRLRRILGLRPGTRPDRPAGAEEATE